MRSDLLWMLTALMACATPGARPHDMSAREHDAEAERHQAMAEQHEGQYDPQASRQASCASSIDTSYDICWANTINPTQRHRDEAERHMKHAADHRAASAALREAEAKSCAGIAPGDRDISPFVHVEDIIEVAPLMERGELGGGDRLVGATVKFRPVEGMTVERLQRIVDCHLARNAALGNALPTMPDCPLVPKGAEARVSTSRRDFVVAIRAFDPAAASEILARAQRLTAPAVSAR